jgi:phosphoribosylformimino-5-aminoimidazole carboxamide ribotide isomerase
MFELMAAIDLREGRVVRLAQGDFDRETVYGEDPIQTAREFAATGVGWLHLVDLDGARKGVPGQAGLIADLVSAMDGVVACQVAGGLRTEGAVRSALVNGARRVVLGTAALDDPSFAGRLVEAFGPERIACAIDVRDGRALGRGWEPLTGSPPAIETAAGLAEVGVRRFVVTAIERDGLLEGPDLGLLKQFAGADLGEIIASGGLSSIADLQAVRELGCVGGIVGRAIYEGTLDLSQAVRTMAAGS